ncbi:MAG: hypothetical protein SF028_07870 [Candidatus Sumerlaeia bacterium]|nr:hypothetical protein [Candidatus Sumerlaeia bacterium]
MAAWFREWVLDNPVVRYGAPWRRGWAERAALVVLALAVLLVALLPAVPLMPPVQRSLRLAGFPIMNVEAGLALAQGVAFGTVLILFPLLAGGLSFLGVIRQREEEFQLLPYPKEALVFGAVFWPLAVCGAAWLAQSAIIASVTASITTIEPRPAWADWAPDSIAAKALTVPLLAGSIAVVALRGTLWQRLTREWHWFAAVALTWIWAAILLLLLACGASFHAQGSWRRGWGGFGTLEAAAFLVTFLAALAALSYLALREHAPLFIFRNTDEDRWRQQSWIGRAEVRLATADEWVRSRRAIVGSFAGTAIYSFAAVAVLFAAMPWGRFFRGGPSGSMGWGESAGDSLVGKFLVAAPHAVAFIAPVLVFLRVSRSPGRLPFPVPAGWVRRALALYGLPLSAGFVSGAALSYYVGSDFGWRSGGGPRFTRFDSLMEVVRILFEHALPLVVFLALCALLVPRRGRLIVGTVASAGAVASLTGGIGLAGATGVSAALLASLAFGLPNFLLQRIHRLEVVERESAAG